MAAIAAASLEPESETAITPRPSLVSERLAQFSGGGGATNSTNKKSIVHPKPVSSLGPKKPAYQQQRQQQPESNPVPKKEEPTRQVTPPPQVADNETRSRVGTTTPPRTSRYVPPPKHHLFVPMSSAAVRKTPERNTTAPPPVHSAHHSNSSSRSRRPTTHLEVVPEPQPSDNIKTSTWVSPRTKRLQACDDAIGDLKVVPTESEDDGMARHDEQNPTAERGVVENKVSVKDMKAKLWDGTKLKATVSVPTVAEVRTPPRRTTTNTSSPPPSRIAKGLIDVATPQGLAPPVRTTPHSSSGSTGHRETMTSQPDDGVAKSLLLPLQENQQHDDYGPVVMSEDGGVEMLLGESAETVESDGTGPRLPARIGRSFKANVANVLLAPAGASISRQQQQPWVLHRRDVVSEEKKSSESVTTELSLNQGFDVSPAEDEDDDVSVEVSAQQVVVDNHHSRSISIGDFQVDEASGSASDQCNGVEAPVPTTPPPPSSTMELPLSGRPSSDEPDFPPLQISMSPSSSSQKQISTQKPPLSPTAPLRQRNTFTETIDCPPSDDLGDEEMDDAAADVAADKIYAERLPMTPSRVEVTRPCMKNVKTLSPASWQRSMLEDGNNVLDNSNSSRENRSPIKSTAAAPSESQISSSPLVKLQQQSTPGSTLLQMAADSIHALDFEQVMLPQPILSEDGSDSLFSGNNIGDAVPTTTTTSSVPTQVPPEFRQTIADHIEASPPRKLRVADRARALAQWNGGLGAPLRPDDDDNPDNDELSPIRPQSSDGGGVEVMSPRLNHRGTALDDWQRIKSFNSSSFEQNSEFDHVPQFGDSLADDKDWSIDENDPSVDLDPFGVAPISPTDTLSEEVATVSSSVKPIGKPRRDSEPRTQKNRRKRLVHMEALHQQQVVVPPEKGEELIIVPDDPFALDEKCTVNELVEEDNDGSTTFDFDPFAVDGGFGEKVEFTETTEFTEGSDFFGSAAPVMFGAATTKTTTSPDFFTVRNFSAPWTESTAHRTNDADAALNRVDTDFWSYEADISTLHDEDSTRHIEI